ncbi:hypothetical protein FGB62_79g02 [Gracilaria domingensis]|nr:hypothetical protein FGB62_79g02 [Gracilaria domingensis]
MASSSSQRTASRAAAAAAAATQRHKRGGGAQTGGGAEVWGGGGVRKCAAHTVAPRQRALRQRMSWKKKRVLRVARARARANARAHVCCSQWRAAGAETGHGAICLLCKVCSARRRAPERRVVVVRAQRVAPRALRGRRRHALRQRAVVQRRPGDVGHQRQSQAVHAGAVADQQDVAVLLAVVRHNALHRLQAAADQLRVALGEAAKVPVVREQRVVQLVDARKAREDGGRLQPHGALVGRGVPVRVEPLAETGFDLERGRRRRQLGLDGGRRLDAAQKRAGVQRGDVLLAQKLPQLGGLRLAGRRERRVVGAVGRFVPVRIDKVQSLAVACEFDVGGVEDGMVMGGGGRGGDTTAAGFQ